MNEREYHDLHRATGVKVTFSCAICANDPEAAEQEPLTVEMCYDHYRKMVGGVCPECSVKKEKP